MKWAARTSTAARRSEEVCEVVLFTAHASCNPLLHGEWNANIQCRPILTAEAQQVILHYHAAATVMSSQRRRGVFPSPCVTVCLKRQVKVLVLLQPVVLPTCFETCVTQGPSAVVAARMICGTNSVPFSDRVI